MDIKILDSWLREYLDTKATPKQIAETLSLTSVSIERVEPLGNDFVYDIEVTTNHPEMASVVGIAREAGAVLPQWGISATFLPPKLLHPTKAGSLPFKVVSNPKLVNRVLAVVMEVNLGKSPRIMQNRLEASGIRSLNNVIDITNYVMLTIGHPTHVFDYDRLGDEITIREAKQGEQIITLDNKTYTLEGGDIVAQNKKGEIVDLLGIMGLENSVVMEDTKRIVYFINNNNPHFIRKTSMHHGIRTEAAILNEKNLDPQLAYDAMLFGIELFEKYADAKVLSNIIDIYPNKPQEKTVSVRAEKIDRVIGVQIPLTKSVEILEKLGFKSNIENNTITVSIPTFREADINLEEDLIEEIARIYGYQNIPSKLPELNSTEVTNLENDDFYWENRIKTALKYWGLTEVYTYSFVSEDLFEGPTETAVTLANPLSVDYVYMRKTLVPSLLQVIANNKTRDKIMIFELANVYESRKNELPQEIRKLAGVIKKENNNFFVAKGIIEQLLADVGNTNLVFKPTQQGGMGADIYIGKEYLGEIEVLDEELIDFELNFEIILNHATFKKTYKPLSKYPPVIEDIALVLSNDIPTANVIATIKEQSKLVEDVTLLDKYKDTRTFHIVYRHEERNLTNEEAGEIREKILSTVKEKFAARVK